MRLAEALPCCSRARIGVARTIGITHRPVTLAAGIRVIAQGYHVQNVNAYGSRLKTWMRRFNGVATCHLANYLGWRRYLDRNHSTAPPAAFLAASLDNRSRQ